MEGINLSQSMQESRGRVEKKTWVDKGLVGALAIFALVAIAWGGLEWYIGTIDKKISSVEGEMQDNADKLSGKSIDRIGDFSDRSALIGHVLENTVDTKGMLSQLETLMVQNVVLTGYEYDKQEGTVVLKGKTDNFKYLAQQIMVMKTSGSFSDIKVDSLERTKDGKISFSMSAGFSAVAGGGVSQDN